MTIRNEILMIPPDLLIAQQSAYFPSDHDLHFRSRWTRLRCLYRHRNHQQEQYFGTHLYFDLEKTGEQRVNVVTEPELRQKCVIRCLKIQGK